MISSCVTSVERFQNHTYDVCAVFAIAIIGVMKVVQLKACLCAINAEFHHYHIANVGVWRAIKLIHVGVPVQSVMIDVFCVLNAEYLLLIMLSADVPVVILGTSTDLRAFHVDSGVGQLFLNCELHVLAPSPRFIISVR